MRSHKTQRSIVVFDRSNRVSVGSAFLGMALAAVDEDGFLGITLATVAAVVGDGFLFFFSRV